MAMISGLIWDRVVLPGAGEVSLGVFAVVRFDLLTPPVDDELSLRVIKKKQISYIYVYVRHNGSNAVQARVKQENSKQASKKFFTSSHAEIWA